jgi:hypothetical protein
MPFAKRYSDAELRSFRLAIDRRPSIKQLERLHGKEGFLQQAPRVVRLTWIASLTEAYEDSPVLDCASRR